ncbi:hypothetical protein SteCoe_27697 [Stentor coeruleus]|uniref:Uncharacterized protein n=1 Tax=Stentor coeruleus TaxID=5963 RepID=A0A1R2B9W2_9CILI|nr:hypothetical protein SteCoe_27697 [Stentor coeruleus]
MAAYALDIKNPRILAVMHELGIAPEELEVKTLGDFSGLRITKEIQQMRFDFYTAQLKKTVADIKETLKKPTTFKIPIIITPNESENKEQRKSPLPILKEIDPTLVTYKQKQFLQENFGDKPDPRLKTIKSQPVIEETKSNKFKEYTERQKDKFKELKRTQLQSQRKLSENLLRSTKGQTSKDHFTKDQTKKKKLHVRIQSHQSSMKESSDDREYWLESSIQARLSKFDQKIQKSEEVYEAQMRKKREKITKLKEACDNAAKNLQKMKKFDEVELFYKIYEKQKKVKEARMKIEDRIHQIAENKKEQFEKQREIAIDKMRKSEQELLQKSKTLEKRIMNTQKIVQERKDQILRDMIIKQEEQKLKLQEKLNGVKRAKRKFDFKMDQILEKQLAQTHRIEELKEFREKEKERIRDQAIRNMIQREKIQESLAIIDKSPKSKTAQERLKLLGFIKQEPELQNDT